MAETTLDNKVAILSDLWMEYRNDEEFADFIDYNDISLPLAYAISNNIVTTTPLAETFINETWALLLGSLDVEEDTGFETLDELLGLTP